MKQGYMLYISHNRYDLKYFMYSQINTLRSRQNGRPFPDDIFKCIFLNENVWVLIKMSLKIVRKVQINNIPALVQIMAWCRSMMVSLLTHIVTRFQWVNTMTPEKKTGGIKQTEFLQMYFRERNGLWYDSNFTEVYYLGLKWERLSLVQVMACRLFGAKQRKNDDPVHWTQICPTGPRWAIGGRWLQSPASQDGDGGKPDFGEGHFLPCY